jgi:hypothetical protein
MVLYGYGRPDNGPGREAAPVRIAGDTRAGRPACPKNLSIWTNLGMQTVDSVL